MSRAIQWATAGASATSLGLFGVFQTWPFAAATAASVALAAIAERADRRSRRRWTGGTPIELDLRDLVTFDDITTGTRRLVNDVAGDRSNF